MKCFLFLVSFLILICPASAKSYGKVKCPGTYTNHLQGIDIAKDKIYWSYTTKIIRTDKNGTIEKITDAPNHQGDCCFHNDKLYVAVNTGKFNTLKDAKNFVYIYDSDLNFEKSVPMGTEILEGGLGGIEYHNGHFYMVGGIHPNKTHFKIAKYTSDFKLVKIYEIPVGNTFRGVQTINRAYGKFWLGCYLQKNTTKKHLWVADDNFNIIKKLSPNASCGLSPIETEDGTNFMIAQSSFIKGKPFAQYTAEAYPIKIELKCEGEEE